MPLADMLQALAMLKQAMPQQQYPESPMSMVQAIQQRKQQEQEMGFRQAQEARLRQGQAADIAGQQGRQGLEERELEWRMGQKGQEQVPAELSDIEQIGVIFDLFKKAGIEFETVEDAMGAAQRWQSEFFPKAQTQPGVYPGVPIREMARQIQGGQPLTGRSPALAERAYGQMAKQTEPRFLHELRPVAQQFGEAFTQHPMLKYPAQAARGAYRRVKRGVGRAIEPVPRY